MTVLSPVIWLNIMYSPGAFAANRSTFVFASSRFVAVPFHKYAPSFWILKMSKGSSTDWSFPGYSAYLVAVPRIVVHPVKQDVEHESITEQTDRN